MWALPHYPGLTVSSVNQVRFRCLNTPRRGPNIKPLAFVVPGSHSHELEGLCYPLLSWFGWLPFNGDKAVSVFLAGLSAPSVIQGNALDNANREKNQKNRASP